MDPAAWLSLLVERAPALRAAGVTSLQIKGDSACATFAPAPAEHAEAPATRQAEPQSLLNPLDDPATFGGQLPGYDMSAVERTGHVIVPWRDLEEAT